MSHNLIDKIDVDELPKQLAFLDLRHNQCLIGPDETKSIVGSLKDLKQLNGDDLFESNDEDDDQDSEEKGKSSKAADLENTAHSQMPNDTFKLLSERIIERSKQRQIFDATHLDQISKERRLRMDEAKQSIDFHLNNGVANKTLK